MRKKLGEQGGEATVVDSSKSKGLRGYGMQTVYSMLKRDILDMALQPGEPLDETRLSQRFEMSRTPIREALVRLSSEGLVTALPNRNSIVAQISFAELPVYFDALSLMYRVTTRAAAMFANTEDLDRIKAMQEQFASAVEAHDALAMIARNRDLHVAIAQAGGNKYFTELFGRLLDEGRRILRIYYSTFGDNLPAQYVQEHDEIILAIERRDVERADMLATRHAAQIVRQIQSFLDRGIAKDFPLSVERPALNSVV